MTPFEYQVWDAGDCAEYLKESRDYFLSHTRYKDGFPSEIPGKPKRWRAIEVAGWACALINRLHKSAMFSRASVVGLRSARNPSQD